MMYNFETVCKVLQKAETKSDPSSSVDYNIQLQFCTNRNLQEKIYARYLKVAPAPDGQLLKLCDMGSCEIGHMTGSEIFRFFTDIFKRDEIFQAGNCLYLLINSQPCAGILFHQKINHGLGFLPTLVTMPPQTHSSHFRYMFSKLFDDAEVEKQMHGNYETYYSNTIITRLRLEAKQQYSNFLQRKVAEFPLFPYGNAFLGLMFDCAFKESEKFPYHRDTKTIPFAACVKFAFDNDQTGCITKLFGEIEFQRGDHEHIGVLRVQDIMETSKHLVSNAIPPSSDEGAWVAEDVDSAAEEVADFMKFLQEMNRNLCFWFCVFDCVKCDLKTC